MKMSVKITLALVLVVVATCGRLLADPAPTMYVDGNVAVSGTGLSWATAFKTIEESVIPSDVNTHRLILVRGDQQYVVSSGAGINISRAGASPSERKIWRGVPGTNGMGRLPIVSGAVTHNGAAFAPTGTLDKVFWLAFAPTVLRELWAGPLGGEWGDDWTRYTKKNNVNEVQASPGSWYWNGAMLYVHTSSGAHPSNFIIKTTSVDNCFQIYASHVSIEAFEFRHTRYAAARIMGSSYAYVTFQSNIVHHTGDNGLDNLQANSHVEFLDNTLFALPQIGIYTVAGSANITVAGNHVYDSGVGIWGNGRDIAIYENRVSGSTSRAVQVNGDEIDVYNNLIHDNNANINGYAVRAFTPNVAIYNNTFYNNGAYELRFDLLVTNGIVFNNIIWTKTSESRGIQVDAGATGIQSDYNDVYATGGAHVGQWAGVNKTTLADWRTASGQDGHSLSADAKFSNVAADDFRLERASPCRNVGTAAIGGVSAPDMDIEGSLRSEDNRYDLGAYEYPLPPSGTLLQIR